MSEFRRGNLSLLSAFAIAALLGGCAGGAGGVGGVPATNVYYDYSFNGTEIGYMEQFGPVPVYVRGNQSPGDIQAIVAAMNGAPATGKLKFTPATAPTATAYSVVLVFGQPTAGVNYCPGRADLPQPAAGGQIVGTFCLSGRLRSSATVNGSPQTPGAVTSVTTTLFSPDSDPSRRRTPAYN